MKNAINVNQTAFFCSVMLLASKLLILPSLMFKSNAYGGLITIIVMFVFELAILFLLIKIKEKYPNMSFFDLLSSFCGVILTRIIYLVLFVFFVLKMIYVSHETFNFLKLVLYENADLFVYYICLLPVINALAYKGLKSFARTLEVFYFIIIVGVIICSLMWIPSITNLSFNIFENNGWSGLLQSLFKHGFWFCDFAFLFIILDRIKLENNYGTKIMRYSIFTMAIIVFLVFSYYFIYQSSSFFHASAIFDIMQFSTRLGGVSKLDIIPTMVMMFLLFYQMGMFLYCAKSCYKNVLNTKNNVQALIFINILFILLNYFVFYNFEICIDVYSGIFSYFAILISVIIPFLFLLKLLFSKSQKKNIFKKSIIKNYLKY